ncbi:MAG: divergent polysaccharide deacetylase family protein [Candidatus Omnitrophica bacterium]|nr:divergent polysaccharide deacetylase family protein [Candidatus Omnitrophota bacterium]
MRKKNILSKLKVFFKNLSPAMRWTIIVAPVVLAGVIIYAVTHPIDITKESEKIHKRVTEDLEKRGAIFDRMTLNVSHERAGRISYNTLSVQGEIKKPPFDISQYGDLLQKEFGKKCRVYITSFYDDHKKRQIAFGVYRGKLLLYSLTLIQPKMMERPVAPPPLVGEAEKAEVLKPELAPKPCSVVIVIDDVGYTRKDEEMLFSLPKAVTLSIMPCVPHSGYFAREAEKRGYGAILHLPMEATSGADPGDGAITTAMTEKEIRETLRKDLEFIPCVAGVSNHMGSRVTQNGFAMDVILEYLKSHRLFFFDSMTTPKSIAMKAARAKHIPTARRDVFLDNDDDPAKIKKQLETLIRLARRRGVAIGIGHYRENTLKVLAEMLPVYEKEGIKLVRLGDIVK